ncbi:MAG: LLM class flavin-dependent oxidoreductase [Chloroflexota bacterium]|nr:LLM class flavin-dependent oxidoreductase [Chloroflexota bacterium]
MPPEQGNRRPVERGFGVAGALPLDLVSRLAAAAEAAGYRTFWVNDTPDGDGLAALREAASATAVIRLGVGVVPLDRQPAATVARRVGELALPVERLTLGVGSGRAPGGLDRVRAGAGFLREETGATVVVGALGPRMCAVAGEAADGVLLNWLTPEHARTSAQVVERAAAAVGRGRPRINGYVRTALGSAAIARLREEGDRYASYPSYAAHFARMGVSPIETAVAASEPDEIVSRLAPFDGVVDETVVRAITREDSVDAYLALLRAAAPR